MIYRAICQDPRHYNIVELLCDYAPARRFGKAGMEFDLRLHERDDVLQAVFDKGTSKFQLTYDDRATIFRTFVLQLNNQPISRFLLKTPGFIADGSDKELDFVPFIKYKRPLWVSSYCRPLSRRIIALKPLCKKNEDSPSAIAVGQRKDGNLHSGSQSKALAFAMART